MPEQDKYDRLIDAALATYADPESEIRLETRVLAGIDRARRHIRVRSRLIWAGGVAFAASVLLLIVSKMYTPHVPRSTAQTEHPMTAAATPPVERPTAPSASSTKSHRVETTVHPRPRKTPDATPKLPVFPTPAPLSAEETALLHLATQTTSDERKQMLDAQQKSAEPLHIASISIPPIEPPTEGKE